MINSPAPTTDCPSEVSLRRTRFGTGDLLTAMLLSSIAFACQPMVGWEAAACLTCAALAIVMGWGFLAILGSIAALGLAGYQPNPVPAVFVCLIALMAIALGPLAVDKLSRLLRK